MAYETEHSLSTGTPNDAVSTANLLNENEKTIASLSSGSDADYFKISVNGPGLIRIAFDTTTSSTSKLWNIALLDTAGQDYLLLPTRSTAGTAVQVNGVDQSGSNLAVDGLSALPVAGDRFTIATSGADTTIYTVVSASTLTSGASTLTLDKAVSAPADNAYLVFDPVQSSVGASTTLTAQVSAAGTYYLKVAKADVASTAEYGVTATVIPTTEGAGTGDDNDTKQDAADSNNRLLAGTTMTGNLSASTDVDYWLFTTASASDFTLAFAAAGGNASSNEWSITATDWAGQSILDSAGTAISLNAGTSASASISDERNSTAKTYVVKVAKADGATVNTGNYTLKVSGTNLDLNDTPSMTIGAVTSASSGALIDTGTVKSLPAGASGTTGTPINLTSLFSASDADSGQTLGYKFTLVQPNSGANTTGYIQVGSTQYGFGVGMTSPANVSLTAGQMATAQFYPGAGTGDLTLTLQAIDSQAASDGSSNGALLQMTLRVVSAGTSVTVADASTAVALLEGEPSSQDTLNISLGAAPATGETVTIYLEHGDEAAGSFELDFSTAVLTFNNTNYSTPQSVILTAREDNTKEASQTGKVSFRVVSSDTSSAFHNLAVDTLTYTLTDAANHAPTGSVELSGTPTQGQTLTASNTLADSDGLGTITYTWQESSDGLAGWSTISGSTNASTYTLVNGQVGKYVRVLANYTDQESNAESVASSATAAIANINDAPTVANMIADQTAVEGRLFSYTVASNAFSDVDPADSGGTLSYSVAQITSASDETVITGGALGTWLSFASDTRTFSSNAVGVKGDYFFKVTATDNAGTPLAISDIFKITVADAATGTPVLAAALVNQAASEDSSFIYKVADGTFTDTDNTNGSTVTTSALSYTVTQSNGDALPVWLTATPNAAGGIAFSGTPTNSDVGTLSVKVTASDGTLSTSDIFDIVIANTNDQPTGSVTLGGTATQGNTLTMTNDLVDADGLGTLAYQWQSSADTGTSWSNISGANSTTYKLTQSEVGKLVRGTISYTDARGTLEVYTTSGNLDNLVSVATTAVTNINDAPIATDDTATAVEAGGTNNGTVGTNPTGNVLTNDTDVDSSDAKTVSAISGGTVGVARAGTYGSLTLNTDGGYTYTIDNANATLQALRGSSNTLTDTFTYTVRDTAGLTDTGNLVVTIQGANDAPTVATAIVDFDANNAIKFYAGNAQTYTFASNVFNDVDNGDTLTYTATQADNSALPSWLSFDAATRTFSTSEAPIAGTSVIVKLTATDLAGATVSDEFAITVQDPGTAAPTLSALTAIAYTDTSADNTFIASTDVVLNGAPGSAPSTSSESLTYSIVGGTDGGTTWSKVGTYGTLTLTEAANTSGDSAFTFTPNDTAIEALTGAASESFTVKLTDPANSLSATRLLTVSVSGVNDTPSLTAPTVLTYADTANTDDFTAQSGTLTASDRDAGATLTYGITGITAAAGVATKVGAFGTLTVNTTSGNYTYTPDDIEMNRVGFDTSETFSLTVSDGTATTPQTLTVSITGVDDTAINDRPKLTTASTLTGASEGNPFTINFSDLIGVANEADGEASVAQFRVEVVSSGTLTSAGSAVVPGETVVTSSLPLLWTPGAAQNGTLNAFTMVAIDNQGLASLTPVQVQVSVAADTQLTSSGSIVDTQANEAGVDANGSSVAGANASGAAAALMTNITDAGTATLSITQARESTAGTLTSVTPATTSANGGLSVIGLYGTLVVGADGSYAYTVNQTNSTVQALKESGSLTDAFVLQVTASTGATGNQTLNIVIDGTNDALPTGASDSLTLNEDTTTLLALTDFGTILDTGLDAATSIQSVKITTLETAGDLEYSADGSTNWTDVLLNQEIIAADITAGKLRYTPAADANGTPYDSIGFKVGDGDAYSSSAYGLTLNVTPVADATVFGGNLSGTVTENVETTTATGTLTVTDPDAAGDSAITAQTDAAGTYGTFSIGTNGAWTYTLSNSDADTTALVAGASVTDVFNVVVGSGATQAITVTVTGANDAPTASNGTVTAVAATPYTFSAANFGFSDVDTGAALSAVRIDTLPTVGTFELGGIAITQGQIISAANIGTLKFTPAQGASGSNYANFTYSVSDGTTYNASPATMTINAGYTLTGTVKEWKDGTNLTGATVTVNGQPGTVGSDGAFTVAAIDDADGNVTASASLTAPKTADAASITELDALATLTIVVTGKASNPYKYIAADYNADGTVDELDALRILTYVVNATTKRDPEWVFTDVADAGYAVDGGTLTYTHAGPHPIDQDMATDTTIDLIGILRGDVDGSWAPAA